MTTTSPPHRVQFEVNADDYEHMYLRIRQRMSGSKEASRNRWRELLTTCLTVGAIFFAIPLTADKTLEEAVLVGAVGLAFGALVYLLLIPVQRSKVRRTFQQVAAQACPQPYLFEVELHEDGLHTRSPRIESRIAWSFFDAIEITDRAFEFWRRDCELVLVQRQAFATPAEESAFFNAARRLHQQATSDG